MFSIWYLAPVASCVLGLSLLMCGLFTCLAEADRQDIRETRNLQFLQVAIGGLLLALAPPLMWLPIFYG